MRYFILAVCWLMPWLLNTRPDCQPPSELEVLNTNLHFLNESTHGLLIVHRLLETFNQKVNKYVDLESNQLNFYSNADLPEDIFADPEDWFYDQSPRELYALAKQQNQLLPSGVRGRLNAELDAVLAILDRVNSIRFSLEKMVEGEDLKKRNNLPGIYKTLEECVDLYDRYNEHKQRLKQAVQQHYLTLGIEKEAKPLGILIAIHEDIRAFLQGVRAEDENNLTALARHLENNLLTARDFAITDRPYRNALRKAEAFGQVAKKYLDGVPFPPEYKLYGNTYYYYNVEMVAKFNRYGSGLVADINQWVTDKEYLALLQLEEPHFFKVIYPKREIPKVKKVETLKPEKVPSSLMERAVVVKQQRIQAEPGTITIEVYDHQLADGDIVSLNYNGHWILENYQLRRRARILTLPLKPTNDNYLILHAVNLGEKPPNTVTLSYHFRGEKKTIVMESDMNESEMIQINIVQ